MSDAELEAEILRHGEEVHMEALLNRHPDVLRLLLHVDPVALASAAAAVQLIDASGEARSRLRRIESGLQDLCERETRPKDLSDSRKRVSAARHPESRN